MALFRLPRAFEPSPLVRGEGLHLRPAAMDDYEAWAALRVESRNFLTPWEPTWPADDLTRGAFRRRLRRNSDDMARDEAVALLIFSDHDGSLLGGLTIGQGTRDSSIEKMFAPAIQVEWAQPGQSRDRAVVIEAMFPGTIGSGGRRVQKPFAITRAPLPEGP